MENLKFIKNAKLKNYCTFQIGGKAKYLYVATSNDKLIKVCVYLKEHNISFKIIGYGSNLLFDDKGYKGAIIINKASGIKFSKNYAIVDCGTPLATLIDECTKRKLSGLENLVGIPSTVGGALVNNCGAYDVEIGNTVEWVEVVAKNNLTKLIKLNNSQCKFSYRTSIFKNDNYIILRAKLKLKPEKIEVINETKRDCLFKKQRSQPLSMPSAGCIFKRCEIIPAKVIDEYGLKYTMIGKAQVSHLHSNFIVNTGNAKAKHVKALISLIQQRIYEYCNVMMPIEIEFVPFNPKIYNK